MAERLNSEQSDILGPKIGDAISEHRRQLSSLRGVMIDILTGEHASFNKIHMLKGAELMHKLYSGSATPDELGELLLLGVNLHGVLPTEELRNAYRSVAVDRTKQFSRGLPTPSFDDLPEKLEER